MINTQSLKRAVSIAEQIDSLQRELKLILGGSFSSSAPAKRGRKPKAVSFDAESAEAKPQRKKRRKLSAEALEKIRAGQKKRWAKFHKEQKAEK